MSYVRGADNKKVFTLLMAEVVCKAGLPAFIDLDSNQLLELSDQLGQEFPHHKGIAFSTLRDYKYQLQGKPKYPFSISRTNLDLLSNYVGFEHWKSFYESCPTTTDTKEPKTSEVPKVTEPQVFICYNDADQEVAQILSRRLEESGIACWSRNQKLLIGDNWVTDLRRN